jgi:hypothetical protein
MDLFGKSKTANNVVVEEVSNISSHIGEGTANLHPARGLFNTNTEVFEVKLVFWKRASKINIAMRENIRNGESIVRKANRRRMCKSLALSHCTM